MCVCGCKCVCVGVSVCYHVISSCCNGRISGILIDLVNCCNCWIPNRILIWWWNQCLSVAVHPSLLVHQQPQQRHPQQIINLVQEVLVNIRIPNTVMLVLVLCFLVLCCMPAHVLLYVLNFSAASTNRTSGTTSSTAGAAPLRWDRQTIMFSVNAWVCSLYQSRH